MTQIKANITGVELVLLREKIKPYLTEKRYRHTLSVEKEAARLADLYCPEDGNRLQVAALLHDITKKDDKEKQLQYAAEFGIIKDILPSTTSEVLHALTAAEVAKRDFAAYVDEEIVSAVRYHTTGHDNMTTMEAIVYLADYMEETRTFPGCVAIRRFFWNSIEQGKDKKETLLRALIQSFDMTIKHLLDIESTIDLRTVEARNTSIIRLNECRNEDKTNEKT